MTATDAPLALEAAQSKDGTLTDLLDGDLDDLRIDDEAFPSDQIRELAEEIHSTALVLLGLTGLSNVHTSARLARRGKGAAVVGEKLNSNSPTNLLVRIGLPGLIFGAPQFKGMAVIESWWLIGLTAIAVLLSF